MEQPKNREDLLAALVERTPKSGEMWKEAQKVVPGGLLSGARQFEPYPFYTDRGEGPYIWDVDGNRYIDCAMSFGVLFLGHRPQAAMQAIVEQTKRGTAYGTPHPMEIDYAKRLIECIPCADRVLLCNSGTEATMQAIRIIRAYTGKTRVAKFEGGYHGWHDYAQWSVAYDPETMGPPDRPTPSPVSPGIPDEIKDTILVLPHEDSAFDLIEEYADELAGVMIEPVIGTFNLVLEDGFLQKLREVTRKNNVLLMFDEVVTGFRLALGGGQEYFGVVPDLATYGKIIGGGLPVGAVGCSQDLLDTVFQADFSVSAAGTFSGNPMTLNAGHAMLGYLMENQHIYGEIEARGDRLRNGFNEWAQSKGYPAMMTGISSLFQVYLKDTPVIKLRDTIGLYDDAIRDLQLFLHFNGVLIPWLHLFLTSAAHTDEIVDELLETFKISTESALSINGVI